MKSQEIINQTKSGPSRKRLKSIAIIDKIREANNVMVSQLADTTVTPESTDVQSSAIEESSSESDTVLPFYQMIKDLDEYNADGLILSHVVEYLDPQDCQRLGKIAYVAGLRADKASLSEDDWAWSPMLVAACRDQYLRRKAPAHAQLLRDHVMHWRYDEAKALAIMNPLGLMVACDYKNNRWQKDEHIVNESALEHAWRTGDENFIELFEKLGRYLPQGAFANKEMLLNESEATRATIAGVLQDYADNVLTYSDYLAIYQNAPQWFYGLDRFIWLNRCKITVSTCRQSVGWEMAKQIDIFSDEFRGAAGKAIAGVGGTWNENYVSSRPLLRCLSVKVATAQSSAEHRPVINKTTIV